MFTNSSRRRSSQDQITYICSFHNTISDVLSHRGWKQISSSSSSTSLAPSSSSALMALVAEGGWDFIWADREIIFSIFDRKEVHLESWQKLNHFRNGRELCRKDLMAKNMKKKRRSLEKEGRIEEAQAYDFIPHTFLLPREYSMFVEDFKKQGGIYIMKPIGSAQGKGIFLFSRLSEVAIELSFQLFFCLFSFFFLS